MAHNPIHGATPDFQAFVSNKFANLDRSSNLNGFVNLDLLRRRTIWWPTWKGWLLLLVIFVAPVSVWAWFGEAFLLRTGRIAADTLVVESWIQPDGLHAAAAEYRSGGYRHLVVTGGLTGSKGTSRRRSYSALAERELVAAGIGGDAIIAAETPDVDNQRTYVMAVSVRDVLQARGIRPAGLNIFTAGAHARRSRLVYAKVFAPEVDVGVITWTAWDRTSNVPWWRSSERTLELIKETLAYTYEFLFSSGRRS
ncbi:MAG: hypothetical protein ACREH8_12650 [Opitutaceae bacterium]